MIFTKWFLVCSQFWLKSLAFELVLLHVNDIHVRFEQTDSKSRVCEKEDEEKGECYGGIARLKSAVDKYTSDNDNVVFVNGGDFYQGNIWYTIFKWEVVAHFAQYLKFDAMSPGNHEFDDNLDGFLPFLKKEAFPIVCANCDLTEVKDELGQYISPSAIVERDGHKIGIIGYVTTKTPDISSPYFLNKTVGEGKITFTDEVEAINKEAEALKENKVNIIIALGHSGFDMDKKIAKECPLVDVVVGGHTNTFLYTEPESKPDREEAEGPYPTIIEQPETGRKVPVVQAYAYTKYLGYLKMTFDGKGELTEWEGNPILLTQDMPQDEKILEELKPYKKQIDEYNSKVIGETKVFLNISKKKQTDMGDFLADAISHEFEKDDKCVLGFVNSGSMKNTLDIGEITYGDMLSVLPFSNEIDLFKIKGKDLREAFEYSAGLLAPNGELLDDDGGAFLQVSSEFQITIDLNKKKGSRMKELKVNCGPDSKKVDEHVDLDDEADYNAAAPNYITKGGDGYSMLKENIFEVESGPLDSEVFEKYLAQKTPLEAEDIDHENKRSTIIISGEGESKAEGEAEGESEKEAPEEEASEEEPLPEEVPEEETTEEEAPEEAAEEETLPKEVPEEEADEEETAEEETPEDEAPEEEAEGGKFKSRKIVEKPNPFRVGRTNIVLDGGKSGRSRETNLGNLVTDAMMSTYSQNGDDCTIAIYNSGGIKDSIEKGIIAKKDIKTAMPYDNKIKTIEITGKTLKDVFNHSAESLTKGGFLQVSGIKLTIDTSKEVGSKLVGLEVKKCLQKSLTKERKSFQKSEFVEVSDKDYYKVLAPDYLTDGGDDYKMLKEAKVVKTSDKDVKEVLVKYIKSFEDATITEDFIPEERITILDEFVFELSHIVLEQNRSSETNFGDMVTDAMKSLAFPNVDDCVIAICNSGAIKINLEGKVHMLDINQALPYKNEIKKIQIKGSTLKKIFEHSAEQLGEGGFLQVSGMNVTIDMSKEKGSKVETMEVKKCKDDATDIGEVIDDETYTLLLPKFLLGGDGYEMLKNVKADETADKNQNEIFIEYVKSLPTPITASDISNSNRITILGDSSVLMKSSDDSSSISHVGSSNKDRWKTYVEDKMESIEENMGIIISKVDKIMKKMDMGNE